MVQMLPAPLLAVVGAYRAWWGALSLQAYCILLGETLKVKDSLYTLPSCGDQEQG